MTCNAGIYRATVDVTVLGRFQENMIFLAVIH